MCGLVATNRRRDAVNNYLSKLGVGRHSRMLARIAGDALVRHEVNVTNTGSVDSAISILAFNAPPGAGKDGVPLKQLYGFEKIFLRAGESATVFFSMMARDLTLVDSNGDRHAGVGAWGVHIGSLAAQVCV